MKPHATFNRIVQPPCWIAVLPNFET